MARMSLVRLVLAFAFMALVSVASVAGQAGQLGEAFARRLTVVELPDGPGKAIVVRRCSTCHTTDRILRTRSTREEWAGAISDMKNLGAVITTEEARVLADYLGEHFGPSSIAPTTPTARRGQPIAASTAPRVPDAPDLAPLQTLFDAGKYQQVVDAVPAAPSPQALFIVAQSQLKLGSTLEALRTYRRLVALPESDAWHFIGISGEQLIVNDETTNEREWRARLEGAIESAQRGVEMRDNLVEAHYQLGLLYAHRSNWPDAADAFEHASSLNPEHAYAHYYAGMASYRGSPFHRVAIHFEAFLKLAPDAPERAAVMQIMQTVRGI